MEKRVLTQIKTLDKEIFRILVGDEKPECSKKPSHTQMSIIKYILDNPQKEIHVDVKEILKEKNNQHTKKLEIK